MRFRLRLLSKVPVSSVCCGQRNWRVYHGAVELILEGIGFVDENKVRLVNFVGFQFAEDDTPYTPCFVSYSPVFTHVQFLSNGFPCSASHSSPPQPVSRTLLYSIARSPWGYRLPLATLLLHQSSQSKLLFPSSD